MTDSAYPAPDPVVTVGDVRIGNDLPFVLIAGPCQMESRDHAMMMAEALARIGEDEGVPVIYKTSFDKANRTSLNSPRGIGLEAALPVFAEIRETFGMPVLTDVHWPEQCARVAEVVDILQIPAFLCRQTDLIVAAAKTGRVVNVKKGQFLAPWDVGNIIAKVTGSGNTRVMITERGVSFGYNTLVNDFKGLPVMKGFGAPVVFDATHSVQQPGGLGGASGGDRRFVEPLARAAVAVGVAAVFMETHQDPDHAPSDGPNMVPLKDLPRLVRLLKEFDAIAKQHACTLPPSG